MAIDMNPRTQGMVHPEQQPMEYFLGNFDPNFAEKEIPWKTKRIGNISIQDNGKPYPAKLLDAYRPVPVFVLRAEFLMHQYRVLWGKNRFLDTA
ncbi:MAG: hypothetical protein A2494_01765 [Candidatus Lloydbacteria bacterium RIFOXYC12_FULL_46_25]|uniref:Uncharacterized protein n=1 Tax=Candidatus Lloydbacteria bacterium RIFOXYC12_FULL_46_25 TaxID=1798670 RepID=A0A1G2E2V2_9BACT|nr:MAG: hypothetical protein A2494_01765 [Candidatus Lloydbacteria bacterium RIFOXYC12_FULL_46_25]